MDLAGEMTIFISSHDLSEIDSFATEVAFVDQGRLLFQDSMETLLGRFGSGHVEWDSVFAAIRQLEYNGWLTIESLDSR